MCCREVSDKLESIVPFLTHTTQIFYLLRLYDSTGNIKNYLFTNVISVVPTNIENLLFFKFKICLQHEIQLYLVLIIENCTFNVELVNVSNYINTMYKLKSPINKYDKIY